MVPKYEQGLYENVYDALHPISGYQKYRASFSWTSTTVRSWNSLETSGEMSSRMRTLQS